ncbi:Outer membrane receptor proteins, mostly Fe transport [Bacteroides faecichinchillae]|uniref:Outer membrane receptor proteins, mostly Fe transport n=1 Tax=Bacteroides faecichinchillae TaxID=871325 RepID=A0A1M5C4J0_9BACE|nr:outer membrane beta-barrel family protein [Bacteroides faecichinchillae]THG66366.1 TonB-dependent receptor [Bacteroides faecichinchillae]SHF49527.1 Outer membrane receptor proteins, mostly Fe transport [Bacteroides faecichinchillae]
MKKLSTLLALCLISAMIWAAPADPQIKGRLIDATSKQVIDFADVLLFKSGDTNPQMHTSPDVKGVFSLQKVKPGTYTLMIRLVGYDIIARENLVISDNTVLNLGDIEMKPLENGLAEVEVVAEKRQLVYKLDKKVVAASTNIVGSVGSAVDILENTPSIRVDADGEITFRGSAGFKVYIDGKPSVFSGTQALEQIPAGHIENIEIITTPSAKHDTDGDVGIINIITKKHSLKGLSGMVNLSGSTWLARNIDFLLTQQNNRSRWYVGGQWTDRLRKSDFDQEKTTIVGDQTTVSHSVGPRTGDSYYYTLKGGWNLELSKTSINVDLEGGYGGNKRKGDMSYKETGTTKGNEPVTELYNSIDDYDNDENIGLGSFSVEHRFNEKGHQIAASGYYKYGGHALEYFFNDLNDLEGNRQQGHRAYEAEHRETLRANLDYSLPFEKVGKLEAGYQYYSYLEDGNYSMEWWNPENQSFYWRDDIYNTFYFQEGVNSIYTILSANWKRFEAQAGVRGEHTHTVLKSSVPGANRTKNRFEFFPSVHLGYTFANDHRLLLSFSRRTTRPQLFYMEPYITYRDFYTAEIGNPDIRPEYINSFEMNYRKSFGENSVSATLFHRTRKDKIERLRVPYIAGVTLDSMANVGHDYSTGIELSTSLHPVRWWNTTINGNVYHYKVKNELAAGGKNESSTNYDILWNNLFTLGKYTRLQLDGSFVGPSVTTQGRTDAYWYANLAVRQQLLKRKLTATLAFKDIFRSACYISDIQTADLRSYTKIKPKYPQIMLTLSYTFNSFKGKSSQAKEDRNDMFEGIKH